ncbi:winged helix-turn-helix domain-containing protein [Paracoccus sp. PAR01]|uniref:winged helix-turn-helix domain-containing protein n=1 Tax=Paracoccus sp. PAR01 TaxID=2769282 RepID=UPI00177E2270|nr:winged helix-turn-helix domain-containing protein [Paracoccus sp. PAR01]MBD9528997.1 winged helix-turn-helix transcriptional regulator [Paracoccus sp. PAR01]
MTRASRQQQVTDCHAAGMTVTETARHIGIDRGTVRYHLGKLQLTAHVEAPVIKAEKPADPTKRKHTITCTPCGSYAASTYSVSLPAEPWDAISSHDPRRETAPRGRSYMVSTPRDERQGAEV